MESWIYIAGAAAFGVAQVFFPPALHWGWVAVIAVVYFGSLRLVARSFSKWAAARKNVGGS